MLSDVFPVDCSMRSTIAAIKIPRLNQVQMRRYTILGSKSAASCVYKLKNQGARKVPKRTKTREEAAPSKNPVVEIFPTAS